LKLEIHKKGGSDELDKLKNLFKDYVPVKEWAKVMDEIHTKADIVKFNSLSNLVDDL